MGKPWLNNPKWRDNSIYSQVAQDITITKWFAILWNSTNVFILYKEEYLFLVGMLPIGLFLIYWHYRLSKEIKRFGKPPLSLDPFPGSIGGEVAGEIVIKTPYSPVVSYKVKLNCYKTTTRQGTGTNTRSSTSTSLTSTYWCNEGNATVRSVPKGIRLQFRFIVPSKLPESEIGTFLPNPHYDWYLEVESNHTGTPLKRNFVIPVFATAQTSKNIRIKAIKLSGVE